MSGKFKFGSSHIALLIVASIAIGSMGMCEKHKRGEYNIKPEPTQSAESGR